MILTNRPDYFHAKPHGSEPIRPLTPILFKVSLGRCVIFTGISKGQQAIRQLFAVARDPDPAICHRSPGVFPDSMAPIVSLGSRWGGANSPMMRWGFPPLPPNLGRMPVTNVRNAKSTYWRGWLKAPYRCLVPATSFCEWEQTAPKKTPTWFALEESRPLFAFAGIWRPLEGYTRDQGRLRSRASTSFSTFLTTGLRTKSLNPFTRKRCQVILTDPAEWVLWLAGSMDRCIWPCSDPCRTRPFRL